MNPGDKSVEHLCNLLGQSRLLTQAEVRTAYQQWRKQEAKPSSGERDRFIPWLVANHYVTGYQAQQLAVGRTDQFLLNHSPRAEPISNHSRATLGDLRRESRAC
jgi:hypothetical protein